MIKVVHGSLMLSCYDKLPLFSISPQNELIPKALMNRLDLIERGCVVPVKPRVSNTIITPSSPPNFLNPDTFNLHKIYNPNDEPAAFIDILSPPYNHKGFELSQEGDAEARECEYFKEITFPSGQHTNGNIQWLQMIQTPADFTCDSEQYQGPDIQLE